MITLNTEVKVRRFPLQVGDDIHASIEQSLSKSILKSKHQWIEQAIQEKLDRDDNELLNLIDRVCKFIEGGPAQALEKDLKEYRELISKNMAV